MKKKTKLETIPDYGDHMTLIEFIQYCQVGGFTNDDGDGFYATETGMTNIPVYPSDLVSGKYLDSFSHVVWFNK